MAKRADPEAIGSADDTKEIVHQLSQPLAAIVAYGQGSILRSQAGALPADELVRVLEKMIAEALRAGALLQKLHRSLARP